MKYLAIFVLSLWLGLAIHATWGKADFYQEAIKHHAGEYVTTGKSPDTTFLWNDELSNRWSMIGK